MGGSAGKLPNGTGDWFAAMLLASMDLLVRHLPGGWAQRRGDSFGLVTRIPIPTLNGVLCASPVAEAEDAAALLDVVRAARVPHCLQLRPGSSGSLVAIAQAAGMTRGDDIPAMVLGDSTLLSSEAHAPDLVVRRLTREESGVHLAVASDGFELPPEVLAPLVERLFFPGVRAYVGEVGGEPVATGVGMRLSDAVGIFNVATPPGQRGRGHATAITARAVLDGFADGATRAFLQSTAMAHGLYERLGFRTVERWQLWAAEATSEPPV